MEPLVTEYSRNAEGFTLENLINVPCHRKRLNEDNDMVSPVDTERTSDKLQLTQSV